MARTGDLRPGWVRARDAGQQLNLQQRLAEKTAGVLRVPNLMTIAGIGLTALAAHKASHNKPVAAVISAGASFAMDMEGTVARRFGVDDPKWGARTDQAADITKAAIVASTMLAHKTMPISAAALTYGPKAAGFAAGIVTEIDTRQELPSSKVGKVAEVCRDVMPLGYLVAAAGKKFEKPWLEKTGRTLGAAATTAAFVTGTIAAVNYAREAWRAHKATSGQ